MVNVIAQVRSHREHVSTALRRCALALVLATPAVLADQHPNDQRPYVDQMVLTQSVNADRTPGAPVSGTVSGGPVVVWTRMHGTAAGIDALRAGSADPVRHMWHVRCGASANEMLLDDVSLGIGTAAGLPSMGQEVDMRGFFDWRTWSRKQNLMDCDYRVVVADAKGQPLHCADRNGPCEISFTARRQ